MRRVLFLAAIVTLLAACETHVKGPENVVLRPEGEPVVVTLAGDETREGELLEITGDSIILEEHGRYLAVDLSKVQRVQVKRYGLSLEASWPERLPPYSRYPQGLTTEQRGRLLEESGQKDYIKLFEGELIAKSSGIADKKTDPVADIVLNENHRSHPATKESASATPPHLFDSKTGINWIIVPTLPVDLVTALNMCKALETNEAEKYRLPTLHEFEQLWKAYKEDERLSIFNKKEYNTGDEDSLTQYGYTKTFSFEYGTSGNFNTAQLVCVRKKGSF